MNNKLINLGTDITKKSLQDIAKDLIQNENPLQTYIEVKAMETIVKDIIENKSFRKLVKENFLKVSEGALSKTNIYGVVIGTVSTVKKMELAKDYIYSDEVDKMQSEIELLELQLKSKKDLLKGRKLLEINNGTAQELMTGFVPQTETDVLDTFNLTITFK